MPEYSVQIVWSNEDGAYIAAPLELAGCLADGQTPEDALKNLRQVILEWIEVAKAEGRPIPDPMTVEDHERMAQRFQAKLHEHIQNEVEKAVQRVISQFSEPRQMATWHFATDVDLVTGGGRQR
jgi:predicted RNase H-like HicB family nuclease